MCQDTEALNGALLVRGDDGPKEFEFRKDKYLMMVEIEGRGAPLSVPLRCEDLCAEAILGGEKGDDLPKDVVREIADAVHWRFYWFLRSRGASGRTVGSKIYIRRRR